MLPQNKVQEVIFTAFMAFVMVYFMICYNIAISVGGIYQKRLIGLFIKHFDDIAAVGTAKGNRARLLGKYIQTMDISSDEVEPLEMQSQTTDRHVQRLSSMKVENFRGFGTSVDFCFDNRNCFFCEYTGSISE